MLGTGELEKTRSVGNFKNSKMKVLGTRQFEMIEEVLGTLDSLKIKGVWKFDKFMGTRNNIRLQNYF